ncbi:uncharacterized protein B0H18DRAFT_965774 [Fomitopsis serialis]|uniref:uncharacterized protein n=1 Tax=Fomitopsis serialis TaxID=139415 RepID=UPI0020089388|nr:uncharacterized protein B0H18DRAFT_965774 [Neoantrodia serialis]KAH9938139.1 hypothetical protein B0H18DRAFT_965774 [Neoantrodia serialis]
MPALVHAYSCQLSRARRIQGSALPYRTVREASHGRVRCGFPDAPRLALPALHVSSLTCLLIVQRQPTRRRTPSPSPSTDYGAFVLAMVAHHGRTSASGPIDQRVLRKCLGLASSHLITDTTMNPEHGLSSWHTGFQHLIDVLVALHNRGELELETVNAASKACSECWTVAGSWREMDAGRESVRGVAARLKGLLDDNGKTYRGGGCTLPDTDYNPVHAIISFFITLPDARPQRVSIGPA